MIVRWVCAAARMSRRAWCRCVVAALGVVALITRVTSRWACDFRGFPNRVAGVVLLIVSLMRR